MKQSPEHVEAIRAAKADEMRFEIYAELRRHMENLWSLIQSKPIKFPAPTRRRRSDRQLPKAA